MQEESQQKISILFKRKNRTETFLSSLIASRHKTISINFHREDSSPRKATRSRWRVTDFVDNRVTEKRDESPFVE